ncbi:MAG: DUF3990 domain-containing protein [Clostridia bacterium]|nr:DUF3990 domain-containing protein [Clostridia bacterium]
MTITVYHGSPLIVKRPSLAKSKTYNDFGVGFYCTKSAELSKEWAVTPQESGYSNKYALSLDGLEILDLNSRNYSVLHWLALLLKNRAFTLKTDIARQGKNYILANFSPKTEGVDVIRGARADDSNFLYVENFLNNSISVRHLSETVRLGRSGDQIALVSEKAMFQLTYIGCESADSSLFYPSRAVRNDRSRLEYLSARFENLTDEDVFLSDLLRGGIDPHDPRLQ